MSHLSKEEAAKKAVDKWMEKQENKLFEVDKFKAAGKENDDLFQTLVFMGRASEQMSLGFTIAHDLDEIPQSIKDELRELSGRYRELQNQIRELKG